MRFCLVIMVLCLQGLSWGSAKDPIYDELEGLDLVEALIRDGKLDGAKAEMLQTRPSSRFWLVSGHLHMAAQNYKDAVTSYEKAAKDPKRQLYLARAHHQLGLFTQCAEDFRDTHDLWLETETDVILKANCEFKANSWESAWQTLVRGQTKHDSFALARERISLLLEMALVRQAHSLALNVASRLSVSEILVLSDLFNDKKANIEAAYLIELARARAPFDLNLNLLAAQMFFQLGHLQSTSEAYERASRQDKSYAHHVTEIRRQLGHYQQAAYFSQLIPDHEKRLKTRMALYVDRNQYPLIASMEAVLSRSELQNDGELRYALAYSLLRQGDAEKSLIHLDQIRQPEFLEKSALLKRTALDCRNGMGVCRF